MDQPQKAFDIWLERAKRSLGDIFYYKAVATFNGKPARQVLVGSGWGYVFGQIGQKP